MSRQPMDYSLCLPKGWRQTISPGDMGWIGRSLFVAKGKMTGQLKLWWYPPGYEVPTGKPPDTCISSEKAIHLDAKEDVADRLQMLSL